MNGDKTLGCFCLHKTTVVFFVLFVIHMYDLGGYRGSREDLIHFGPSVHTLESKHLPSEKNVFKYGITISSRVDGLGFWVAFFNKTYTV